MRVVTRSASIVSIQPPFVVILQYLIKCLTLPITNRDPTDWFNFNLNWGSYVLSYQVRVNSGLSLIVRLRPN